MAIALTLSAFTACSAPASSVNHKNSDSTTTSTSTSDESTAEADYFKKYSPEITLTENKPIIPVILQEMPEGQELDNNPWTEWYLENYGVSWKTEWVTTDDSETNKQKINMGMVSDDLPDVIETDAPTLKKLIESNKVIPLDDLINHYATPLTKYLIEEMDEATQGSWRKPFEKDGEIYALPTFVDIWAGTWNHNWIRKDILDELNMPVSKTIEDYEKVMGAYKAENPEALALPLNVGNQTAIGGMTPVTLAYGAYSNMWIDDGSGNAVYGSIQPETKEARKTLNKWYNNGWIDSEFVVKDNGKASERVINGDVLGMYGHWSCVWSYFQDLNKNNENANMMAYEPFAADNIETKYVLSGPYTRDSACRAISTSCENPEAVIIRLNELNEQDYRNDDEMRKLMKEKYKYDLRYESFEVREPTNKDTAEYSARYTHDYPEELVKTGVMNGYGYDNFG